MVQVQVPQSEVQVVGEFFDSRCGIVQIGADGRYYKETSHGMRPVQPWVLQKTDTVVQNDD